MLKADCTKTAEEVCSKFRSLLLRIKTIGWRMKRFRCDNGSGEYSNELFKSILEEEGINFEPSPPHSHDKNGVAERAIRTIDTFATAVLLDAGLPMSFWSEAVATVIHVRNRSPHSAIGNKSPYEVLHGVRPAINHFKRFGCAVYRWILKEQRDRGKFVEKSKACMFLGYVNNATKI